jgi:hypothetical protein
MLLLTGREADALSADDEGLRLLLDHVDLQRARAMALLRLRRSDQAEQQRLMLASRSATSIQDEWQSGAIRVNYPAKHKNFGPPEFGEGQPAASCLPCDR